MDKILIIDFGSQYAQLIARRVREFGVYCELIPYDTPQDYIINFSPKAIIFSGSPSSVTQPNAPYIPEIIFDLNIPLLGICYGMQTMAHQLGGKVETTKSQAEYGNTQTIITSTLDLLSDLSNPINVWMSHEDQVTILPPNFTNYAHTINTKFATMANLEKRWYGAQFHPEVTHTKEGTTVLHNFVFKIAECSATWTANHILEDIAKKIQNQVQDNKVLLALSGGVDSSVVAALLNKIIPNQLVCIFVDTGLLRLNEGDQVMETFAQNLNIQVIRVNAQDRFFNSLQNITDPEIKRKVIGKLFIDIFTEEASKLQNNIKFLAQGTIYSDVIESNKKHTIKSHHNVGGLPDNLQFELIEPIKHLFKDEVKQLGTLLNLPDKIIYRHPFPGPGLGIRILGEVKPKYVSILQKADNIFIQTLIKYNYYNKTNQAFAVFLPIKSVGVTGDNRKYEYVITLRAVDTTDYMTASWSKLPYDLLEEVSSRIVNEVNNVSRVVYDITGKPPATIEWE